MSKNPKLLSLLLKQTTKNSSSLMTGERDPNGVLFVHEFDSDGKIVEVIDGVDASWIFSSTTTSTSQRYDLTNPEGEIIAYSNIGRVFTTTLLSGDIITKTTTYNNHGELLTQSDNTLDDQLEVYGNNTYTYNDDGYLTQKTTPEGTTSYSYGTLGELLSVTTPTKNITYLHDANNQRVAKLVDGNIVEKYLWEDLITLLAIYDANDNLVQRFEYVDGRMPISMTSNSQKYYLHYNQVGTLKAVSNQQHQIVKQLTYDTYGNILNDTNASFKVPFRFAGGLYDADTKLIRFGYRDYDAHTGKWTAKDPIDFGGEDTNLYGYVLGDPVNLIDPTGEIWWLAVMWMLTFGAGLSDICNGKDPSQTRPMQQPQHHQKTKPTKKNQKKKKQFPKKGRKWP